MNRCNLFRVFLTATLLLQLAGIHAQPDLRFIPHATGLTKPVDITHCGDDRLFIAEQVGRLRVLNAEGELLSAPFLDISNKVSTGTQYGILGFTFHPDYPADGRVFVYYTDSLGDSRIVSYLGDPLDPNQLDSTTEALILSIDQPFADHQGGDLNFGPDGYLYIALGDGGSPGDPDDRGQDPKDLLGKILRLDIDAGAPYTIPPDNPFVGDSTTLDEIWALGTRNPWRASFDRLTGDYWFADVGQEQREEINVEPAGFTGGANYGWSCFEGSLVYNDSNCLVGATYTFPAFEYTHDPISGGLSVTGGYVYRGLGNTQLAGKYLFCDFLSGNFWTMAPHGVGYEVDSLGSLFQYVVTFGEDAEGELYLARFGNDTIYKVVESCSAGSRVTGLNETVSGPNSAYLSWDPLPGALGYRISGRKTGTVTYKRITTTQSNYTVNILQPGTSYEWYVEARCTADGAITESSTPSEFATPAVRVLGDLQVNRGSAGWHFSADQPGSWALLDLTGRYLRGGRHDAGGTAIEAGDLPAGIYLLELRLENGSQRVSKLVW